MPAPAMPADIFLLPLSIGASLGASLAAPMSAMVAQTTGAGALVWQPVLYGLLVLVMLVGVVGAVVPALPGM